MSAIEVTRALVPHRGRQHRPLDKYSPRPGPFSAGEGHPIVRLNNLLAKPQRYVYQLRDMQRINFSLSRAAATSALRQISNTDLTSWEFSAFSQNGEDGIIDVLTRQLNHPSRYFIEIGASDGLENNTSWLALARRYSGLMVDGDPMNVDRCRTLFSRLNYGLAISCIFVTVENAHLIRELSLARKPDIFSLDVDGNDFYIAQELLTLELRPAIAIVEYNSAFGPDYSLAVPYQPDFRVAQRHGDSLYYGCSISAYRRLFKRFGYHFLGVESNGVNAFFVDPDRFNAEFVSSVVVKYFTDNVSHLREYRIGWERQFELIRGRRFVEIAS
jgi:hypothetical protein